VTLIDNLRQHLIDQGIVRAPNVPGPGARPWLPPAWKHPDNGPVGPGDAADQGLPDSNRDDGLVVSLMHAPGVPPEAGNEERRQDGVDVWMRGVSVPAIAALEAEIRAELVGRLPGGHVDWMMGALYVVQSREWKPFQPVSTEPGVFTFNVGYLFETLAA
jgi:hypothetical protein